MPGPEPARQPGGDLDALVRAADRQPQLTKRKPHATSSALMLLSALRRRRLSRDLSQEALCALAGLSRQTLSTLEHGRGSPSTTVALKLARALECTVEDLFSLGDEGPLSADLVAALVPAPASHPGPGASRRLVPGGRVALAQVQGRWVAHPLPDDRPADALLGAHRGRRVRALPLRSLESLRGSLLVLGCDPALGLLAARVAEDHPHCRVTWLHAASEAALGALARGEAHLAGIHLRDEQSGEYNAPFARAALPGSAVVGLSSWELGFVVARGNPRGVRSARDLARRDVCIVNREPGAGARKLLDALLRRARVSKVRGYGLQARGHHAVAQAVALGAADAGIATRGAADCFGLRFLPLSEERFDLVLPAGAADDERVGRLLDSLRSRNFQRELGALKGYQAGRAEVVPA